jgi:clusterin-associated protein 1
MDMDAIERAVRQAVQAVQENILGADRMLEGLRSDEAHLRTKIEKRRAELERSEKRLSTLQSVR